MSKRERSGGRPPSDSTLSARATVSLSPELYRRLAAVAKQKKVSTAWVLREAAEVYVEEHLTREGAESPFARKD